MVVLALPGFFTFGCLKTASKDGCGMFSRSNSNFLLSSKTLTMLLKEQKKLGVFSSFMLHITAAYVGHCQMITGNFYFGRFLIVLCFSTLFFCSLIILDSHHATSVRLLEHQAVEEVSKFLASVFFVPAHPTNIFLCFKSEGESLDEKELMKDHS